MKVYLCSQGHMDDYSIAAIFSTREAAERYAAGDPDGNEVEEYEVDAAIEHVYGPTWKVEVVKDNGFIRVQPYSPAKHRHPTRCRTYDHGRYIAVVSPVSAEHAAKVAVEQRQEWLRTRDLRPGSGPG